MKVKSNTDLFFKLFQNINDEYIMINKDRIVLLRYQYKNHERCIYRGFYLSKMNTFGKLE